VLEVPVGFYVEAGWDTDGEGRFWGREVGGVGGALGAGGGGGGGGVFGGGGGGGGGARVGGEEGFEEGGESTTAQLGEGNFRCAFLPSEEIESWEGRW
jgi:hypothetical protein